MGPRKLTSEARQSGQSVSYKTALCSRTVQGDQLSLRFDFIS